jgi:hypothetical protein
MGGKKYFAASAWVSLNPGKVPIVELPPIGSVLEFVVVEAR